MWTYSGPTCKISLWVHWASGWHKCSHAIDKAKSTWCLHRLHTSMNGKVTECSLRQGAGGTEFEHFGSRTCFLSWFYKRSQAYFGQKPEEHGFSIKKRCLEKRCFLRQMCYLKKEGVVCCFYVCSALFLNFPRCARARAGPIWARKINKNIGKQFAFLGASKVPCTLP